MGLDEWQIAPHDFHRVLMLEDAEVLVATSGYTAVALVLAAGTLNGDVADIAFYVGDPLAGRHRERRLSACERKEKPRG